RGDGAGGSGRTARKFKGADARGPVAAGRAGRVHGRVPERALVDRVDGERAVVAPAAPSERFVAGDQLRLTLGELAGRIARKAACPADAGIGRGVVGDAESDGDVA